MFLHFIQEVVQSWEGLFQSLSDPSFLDDIVGLVSFFEWGSRKYLPMVEHALWEGLASGSGPQVSSESEGLVYRQVSLDGPHGCSGYLDLFSNVTTLGAHHTVDAAHNLFWALDLDQVDGLHESGVGSKHAGIEHTTGGGDDLSTSTMDGISMQGYIMDVEADSAHVLLTQDTLL